MATQASTWAAGARNTSLPPGAEEHVPRWVWSAGTLAGIQIYVHATFLVFLAWIGVSHLVKGQGLGEALAGVALIVAVFATVVLHELGHALTARRYGIRTRHIILLPIGGVASLERMPERPREELLVALAGPAVNVVLAGVFFAASGLAHHDLGLGALHVVGGSFLAKLAWVNVSLAVFNLLPAFPMDGGRVLRAALAMRMDRVRATVIAAQCGQAMALALGLLGMWTNPMLVAIAFFVWLGAREEARAVQAASLLGGLTAGDAMLREYRSLSTRDTIGDATRHMLAGFQADFPVLDADDIVGVLTHEDMIRALTARGADTPVVEAMNRRFTASDAHEPLDAALARLRDAQCDVLPVLDRGALVGILRLENVGELVAVRSALASRSASGQREGAPGASRAGPPGTKAP
jgi:Zn-dependent protease/predicted transcriptional regulator